MSSVGVLSRDGGQRTVTFSWEIPDFFSMAGGMELDSPIFSFSGCNWTLRLKPFECAGDIRLEINLWMEKPYADYKTVRCTVWLKNSEGTDWYATRTAEFTEDSTDVQLPVDGLCFCVAVMAGQICKHVPDGTLTICCSMQDFGSASQTSQTSEPDVPRPVEMASQSSNPVGDTVRLASDLKGLLLSGESSDAVIRVKGQDFPVHRGILGVRTPVFGAMFRHETTESASGVVDIEDAEPDTVQRFLEYVYTGWVEDLTPDTAFCLYEMADKYQVEPLREKCLDCIKSGLSVENICQAITLAMKHDLRELTTLAKDFFAGNIKDIIRSDKWKRFLCENPLEANELFIKVHCAH